MHGRRCGHARDATLSQILIVHAPVQQQAGASQQARAPCSSADTGREQALCL